jgi:transposase
MASLQKRKNRGHDYYYIVESRRINGKPTPIVVAYLGTIENIISKFTDPATSSPENVIKSYSHGDVFALLQIANKIGVKDILDQCFPPGKRDGLNKGESILLMAINRAIRPGSKRELSDWLSSTTLPDLLSIKPDKITSQHCWDQMDGITTEMLRKAEDTLLEKIMSIYNITSEKLSLDYTNYFSYIATGNKKSSLAKRGKNKQKRNDLRQYSLALVTSKEYGMPMYSHVYEGNHADKTEFSIYLEEVKKRFLNGANAGTTFIFDGGSNTKDNLALLKSYGFHYTCAFSLSICKELYDIPFVEYETIVVGENERLCKRINREIWGEKRVCVIYYSDALAKGQLTDLDNQIGKSVASLKELQIRLENPRSRIAGDYKKIQSAIDKAIIGSYCNNILDVKIVSGKKIEWSIDFEAKEGIISKYFGKKLIITDRDEWSTSEILRSYAEQDSIERIFKDTKNNGHFSIRPQYHYTDSKVRVHIFCCLLGLTLTGLLRKELNDKGIALTNTRLLDELGSIRQAYILRQEKSTGRKRKNPVVDKRLEAMSQEQDILWEVVNNINVKN